LQFSFSFNNINYYSSDSESTTVEVDSALPVGAFTVKKETTAQNGKPKKKLKLV
jgi:hypothetical protein